MNRKCRYCDVEIKKNHHKEPAFKDICNSTECKNKMKMACKKVLDCNHPCSGYLNESHCLPCLDEECAGKNKIDLRE